VADLARLAKRELERRGHAAGPVAGHSMGMLINEPPLIAPWNHLILTEGLVIGIEFGPSQPEGFFVLEQLIQVTRDGFDLLTTEPMSLVALTDF
jgi:Xaa-Pro aminopeptidase